jgi:hypothetical protein
MDVLGCPMTERMRCRSWRKLGVVGLGRSGLADQSMAIDSDPPARWVPLAQANVGAVERRAPHFVPTIVALRQEQAWAGASSAKSICSLGIPTDRLGLPWLRTNCTCRGSAKVVAVRHLALWLLKFDVHFSFQMSTRCPNWT